MDGAAVLFILAVVNGTHLVIPARHLSSRQRTLLTDRNRYDNHCGNGINFRNCRLSPFQVFSLAREESGIICLDGSRAVGVFPP
jgi:hypothetical protein